MNADGNDIEEYDDDLDGTQTCPVTWGCQLTEEESGHPNADDPLVPVRRDGFAVVKVVDGNTACHDLENHEEKVCG